MNKRILLLLFGVNPLGKQQDNLNRDAYRQDEPDVFMPLVEEGILEAKAQ